MHPRHKGVAEDLRMTPVARQHTDLLHAVIQLVEVFASTRHARHFATRSVKGEQFWRWKRELAFIRGGEGYDRSYCIVFCRTLAMARGIRLCTDGGRSKESKVV